MVTYSSNNIYFTTYSYAGLRGEGNDNVSK